MKIRVPATSANLGPGFDSCDIALSAYLTINVLGESEFWEIQHTMGEEIPTNEENLLIQTALKIAPELTPKVIRMVSDIPLARGLGSSSSVIVAGIELANRLAHLNLSPKEKVRLATEMEGHPDNVAPAILGDFVVASHVENQVYHVKHHFPMCDVIAFIPEEPLFTEKSRAVLPEKLTYKEAVAASSIANVMIAAILNGDLPLAGKMMEQDKWHETYRRSLVPHLKEIRRLTQQKGAYGSFLSGAGPTVLILSPEERTNEIVQSLEKLSTKASIQIFNIDQEGVQVF